MKILKFIISIGSSLGLGGGWKIAGNIIGFLAVAGLLWLGVNTAWNQATFGNKHYKRSLAALELANRDLEVSQEALRVSVQNIDSLSLSLSALKKEKTADSLMFKGLIEETQGLLKILNKKNKEQATTLEKYRREGRVCYELKKVKTGLFKTREILVEIDCPKDSAAISG